ncbi:MAG: hypothetical protein ABIZ49_08255, partial [Opitutaceae bacterium]
MRSPLSYLETLALAAAGLLLAPCGSGAAERAANVFGFPVISSYAPDDLGTESSGFSGIEDPAGGLLFGTDSLVSYDGDKWRSFPIDGAYGVRGLDFDSSGRLWVACTGNIGWFERGLGNAWQFHPLRDRPGYADAPLGEMWRVFVDRHGPTFIAEDAILRWNGVSFQKWSMPGTKRLLGTRVAGTVYVHYVRPNDGIYAMTSTGPELFIPQSVLGADRAVLWMDKVGADLLMATSDGLFLYRDGILTPFAEGISNFFVRERVTCGIILPDGRYAFGTFSGGIVLVRANGTVDRFLEKKDGVPSEYIRSFLLDRQGGLWATSPSHIFRIDVQSRTSLFDKRADLEAQGYNRIVKSGSAMVLASENGLLELAADKRH